MQKSLRSKLISNAIKGRLNVTFNDIDTGGSHVIDHFFGFLEKINIKNILDCTIVFLLELNLSLRI